MAPNLRILTTPPTKIAVAGLEPNGNEYQVVMLRDVGGQLVAQWEVISGSAIVQPIIGIAIQFGDGITAPVILDAAAVIPLAFSGTFENWRARLDVSGDATFAIDYASTLGGAFASVGGTQPSVVSAVSNEDLNGLDWTTTTFDPGGVIRVTLTALSSAARLSSITLGVRRI